METENSDCDVMDREYIAAIDEEIADNSESQTFDDEKQNSEDSYMNDDSEKDQSGDLPGSPNIIEDNNSNGHVSPNVTMTSSEDVEELLNNPYCLELDEELVNIEKNEEPDSEVEGQESLSENIESDNTISQEVDDEENQSDEDSQISIESVQSCVESVQIQSSSISSTNNSKDKENKLTPYIRWSRNIVEDIDEVVNAKSADDTKEQDEDMEVDIESVQAQSGDLSRFTKKSAGSIRSTRHIIPSNISEGYDDEGKNSDDDEGKSSDDDVELTGTYSLEEKATDPDRENIDSVHGQSSAGGSSRFTNISKNEEKEPSDHIVFVSNVAPNANEKDLEIALSPYGKAINIKFLTDPISTGSRSYAFVSMASSEEAANLLENLDYLEVNGQLMRLEKYDDKKATMLRRRIRAKTLFHAERAGPSHLYGGRVIAKINNNESDVDVVGQKSVGENSEAYNPIGQEVTGDEKEKCADIVDSEQAESGALSRSATNSKDGENKSNDRMVWVSNVAASTRAIDLEFALLRYGKVRKVQILVSARYPGSSCCGRVTMASSDGADRVIQNLNNTELNGRMIKIEKYDQIKILKKIVPSDNTKENQERKSDDDVELMGSYQEENKAVQNMEVDLGRDMSAGEVSRYDTYKPKIMFKERVYGERPGPSTLYGRKKDTILTFAQIKAERERQKNRDIERRTREEIRRKEEDFRQKEDYKLKMDRGNIGERQTILAKKKEEADNEKLAGGSTENKNILAENTRDEKYERRTSFDSPKYGDNLSRTKSFNYGQGKGHGYDQERYREYDRGRSHDYDHDRERGHPYNEGRGRDHDDGRERRSSRDYDYSQGETSRGYQRDRKRDYDRGGRSNKM